MGFSKNNNFFSYVHGNTLVRGEGIDKDFEEVDFIKTSLFKKNIFKIQKKFTDFDKNEFFILNPTSKIINLEINKKKYRLKKFESIIVSINKIDTVEIISNCYFLRPTIFSYKKSFFDVHHG